MRVYTVTRLRMHVQHNHRSRLDPRAKFSRTTSATYKHDKLLRGVILHLSRFPQLATSCGGISRVIMYTLHAACVGAVAFSRTFTCYPGIARR